MFTGIVECVATVKDIIKDGTNVHFVLESPITNELKVDQSVAHNGVCLTVVEVGATYRVTAVAETLAKTNLHGWKAGSKINLERSLRVGDRLDGHFVQGHVDTRAECVERRAEDGNAESVERRAESVEGRSWLFRFRFPEEFAALVIEKGSICINGVSLTVFNVGRNEFTVTIIPYTFNNTNFNSIEQGSEVNLEFDVLGKYLQRIKTLNPSR
jgi:riboflavin synthase